MSLALSSLAIAVLAAVLYALFQKSAPTFSLLRCTGIVLLTDYARTLCEEAGAESLAWCAALAGRLLVLAAAWPLLEEIGQRIWSVLG